MTIPELAREVCATLRDAIDFRGDEQSGAAADAACRAVRLIRAATHEIDRRLGEIRAWLTTAQPLPDSSPRRRPEHGDRGY
jgi:hypothetical protein